ncbi:MAG TPA: porin, partial [Flavisolibacter sp.]
GLSFLSGGWVQASKYRFEMSAGGNTKTFSVDSSLSNIGRKALRQYYGTDAQLIWKHGWGKTEVRGEYWTGTQPGTVETTVNPGALPVLPMYIREFDGAFFYFLQNIVNEKWEVMAKYDWYDPNTKVSGTEIGAAGTNLTPADIRYSTIGVGFTHYFTDHLKLLFYYDMVENEKTQLPGFVSDIKDNIFTCRMQLRF